MTETTFSKNPNLKNEALLAYSRQIPAALLASQPAQFASAQYDDSPETIAAKIKMLESRYALLYRSSSEPESIIAWAELDKEGNLTSHHFPEEAILPADPDIRAVLRKVNEHGAVLFKAADGRITGVVFPPDFDKPAARVYLYTWVMRLEIAMTEVVKLLDEKAWKSALKAKYAMPDVAYRYLEPIETLRIEHLYFNDIYRILKDCVPGFPKNFVPETTIKLREIIGELNTLRNQIMHAVKPLVNTRAELAKIEILYQVMAQLIHNLEQYKRGRADG